MDAPFSLPGGHMAHSRIDEVIQFWQTKGMAPCAEAQADGVPCPSLGRHCETCAQALRALEDARAARIHQPPEVRP